MLDTPNVQLDNATSTCSNFMPNLAVCLSCGGDLLRDGSAALFQLYRPQLRGLRNGLSVLFDKTLCSPKHLHNSYSEMFNAVLS